jgi:phosphotriesterase-related protein
MIMTVTGPLDTLPSGALLPHEHVMSIFGRDRQDRFAYDEERLFGATIPYLRHLRSIGLGAIADCTAAGIGRRPDLLQVISRESGVAILSNTGYYGAARGRYLPEDLALLSTREISERWIREYDEGIDGSGIRPGFIKTGIDDDRLSAVDRKLIAAAALAHRRTGLLIQTHTGDHPRAAGEILEILRLEGVHPSAWVWVHAHLVQEVTHLIRRAHQGCWVSLDGVHAERDTSIIATLLVLKAEGLLGRVLLSHDGNTYTAEGSRRSYDHLLTEFRGKLLGAGFTEAEFDILSRENPSRAFGISPRLLP